MNTHSLKVALVGAASGIALCPTPASAADVYFTGGPSIRGGMSVRITGSSYAEALNTDIALGLGARNAYANRTYDDGYVRLAPSTGNPTAMDPNTTWNWGYNNASQYSAGNTLSFHRNGVPRYTSFADGATAREDDMMGAGVLLEAGLPLLKKGRWSVDLVAGFQGLWGASSQAGEVGRLYNITDTYAVGGISPFPAAGHQGTYGGPFDSSASPPYTIIPNLPAQRTTAASGAAPAVVSSIRIDVEHSLYQLSLGPRVGYAACKRWQVGLTPTVSLNVLEADVERRETFSYGGTSRWYDHSADTEVHLGFGITGGVNYDLGKGWFVGARGGYEWVLERMDLRVGPNWVSLDASGWTVGLAIGRKF